MAAVRLEVVVSVDVMAPKSTPSVSVTPLDPNAVPGDPAAETEAETPRFPALLEAKPVPGGSDNDRTVTVVAIRLQPGWASMTAARFAAEMVVDAPTDQLLPVKRIPFKVR